MRFDDLDRLIELERKSLKIMNLAIWKYKPVKVFALLSGGHDSVSSTLVASKHPSFSGVVHINTGIGIEETRSYVRKLCVDRGWPLTELHPPSKSYEEIVLEHGFPGPAAHRYMYIWLKERAIQQLIRDNKTTNKDRIVLVTGVRKQESARRMGTVKYVHKERAYVWVAPILDWEATDRLPYMEINGVDPNPVVSALHMSGECLCGAFAKPNELAEISLWFPDTAARIRELEYKVSAAGHVSKWGEAPENYSQRSHAVGMLCQSCVDES